MQFWSLPDYLQEYQQIALFVAERLQNTLSYGKPKDWKKPQV